jgi:hypothetical protein
MLNKPTQSVINWVYVTEPKHEVSSQGAKSKNAHSPKAKLITSTEIRNYAAVNSAAVVFLG